MTKIVECVPNISEGRDQSKIDYVVNAARRKGVEVLDVDPGEATNRTVITLVGEPEVILEAAFDLIKAAAEVIDMSVHKGEHPRMGATDVCPFIPVQNISMEECAELAKCLAKRVGEELSIPVYLYEHAAPTKERQSLAYVRQGEYEALPEKLVSKDLAPDFGPTEFNAKAGATAIGARPFLIAYNINLNTKNKKLANWIAFRLRESGYRKRDQNGKFVNDSEGNPIMEPGRFKCCRAVGWFIEEFGIAQISINLTDFNVTSMHHVVDEAEKLAAEKGLRVTGSEIVGLVPKAALLSSGLHYLKKQGATIGIPEKEIMLIGAKSLGLSDLYEFKLEEKIIEERIKETPALVSMAVNDFNDLLSTDAPAPGGGSVAALCGALSASLSSMVSALTHGKLKKKDAAKKEVFSELGVRSQTVIRALIKAVDDDTSAFDDVMAAFRIKAATDEEQQEKIKAIVEAYKKATSIPLHVAEQSMQALKLASDAFANGLESTASDGAVAIQTARTAFLGASYNVQINLKDLKEEYKSAASGFISETENRLQVLHKEFDATYENATKLISERFAYN